MNFLADFLGVSPNVVQLTTAILGLVAAACGLTSTVLGILNRRIRKRTEKTTEETSVAAGALVVQLAEMREDYDALWGAYLAKDAVANPEGVRRIATETATAVADAALAPMKQFYAAIEIVEHRREHRPETDVIRILQEIHA